MKPATRLLIWSTTCAVGGTGLTYAWMAYCIEPRDEMDAVNHPWQPALMEWHLLTAPLWMFAFGVIWQSHVWPKLRAGNRARRRTGLALLALAIPMAASGYLLQISIEDRWRALWVWVHVSASLLWLCALAAHCLSRHTTR